MSSTQSSDSGNYKYKNASFLSKISFWWMTPLLWRGYFDPLELDDLGHLPEDDSSRSHYDQFLIIYQSLKVTFIHSLHIHGCMKTLNFHRRKEIHFGYVT